jgi:bacteriorhodopsin
MKTKEDFQKQAVKEILSSDYVKYTLYGLGAIAIIYVSGIIMKVIGNTANSYKFMSNSLKQ